MEAYKLRRGFYGIVVVFVLFLINSSDLRAADNFAAFMNGYDSASGYTDLLSVSDCQVESPSDTASRLRTNPAFICFSCSVSGQ